MEPISCLSKIKIHVLPCLTYSCKTMHVDFWPNVMANYNENYLGDKKEEEEDDDEEDEEQRTISC